MGHITKDIYKNNPLVFKSDKTEAINEAYKLILEAFKEYVEQHELTEKEIDLFNDIFRKIYLERKASVYFEDKLSKFSQDLHKALTFALKQLTPSNDKSDDFAKILYYKNKKRLINNEQY